MIAEDEESPIIVLAKLKGLIVRDLFGQIAKNIRSEKKFFLRLCPDGIRMFFFELGKETEIEINLRKDMFPVYSYLVEGRHIYKFDIKEFEFAGLFFENTTIPLTLKFTSTDVQFSN